MASEIAMLHDVTKCTGCRGCTVACKAWKDLPADAPVFTGEFQAPENLTIYTFNIILMRSKYLSDGFRWDFFKFQCMHCGDPACVKVCPTGALSQRTDGIVWIDNAKCIGCGFCETNCPFHVPKIDKSVNKSTKCDLCFDRVDHGMVPACAKTCTSDCILFGTREEMTKIAKERLEVLRPNFPDAQLYGVDKSDGIGGSSMMYILAYKPSVYGMPDNPEVSPSIKVWQDITAPLGKFMIGAAAVTIAGAALVNAVSGKKDDEGGK